MMCGLWSSWIIFSYDYLHFFPGPTYIAKRQTFSKFLNTKVKLKRRNFALSGRRTWVSQPHSPNDHRQHNKLNLIVIFVEVFSGPARQIFSHGKLPIYLLHKVAPNRFSKGAMMENMVQGHHLISDITHLAPQRLDLFQSGYDTPEEECYFWREILLQDYLVKLMIQSWTRHWNQMRKRYHLLLLLIPPNILWELKRSIWTTTLFWTVNPPKLMMDPSVELNLLSRNRTSYWVQPHSCNLYHTWECIENLWATEHSVNLNRSFKIIFGSLTAFTTATSTVISATGFDLFSKSGF